MRSRRLSDDITTLSSLPDLFERPLEDVTAVVLKSESEADSEFCTLKEKLEPTAEWDVKCKAIQRLLSLIKGGAFEFQSFDVSQLVSSIAASIGDLRSSLVKWSALCTSALAQTLSTKFSNFVDIFLPPLFKQSTHGTAIISMSCHLALLQIASKVPSRRTARAFLIEINSKSYVHRLIVAESIGLFFQNWPSSVIQGQQRELIAAIASLKVDASSEVRNAAREVRVITVPKVQQRSKSPVPKSLTKNRYGSLKMPPPLPIHSQFSSSETKTRSTTQKLTLNHSKIQEILDLDGNVSPSGIKDLISDIRSDLDNPLWPMAICKIIPRFKTEVQDLICAILVLLHMNEEVIKACMDVYEFDVVLMGFDDPSDSLAFIEKCMQIYPNLSTGKEQLQYLQLLSHTLGPSTALEELIKRCQSPVFSLFSRAVALMSTNTSLSPLSPSISDLSDSKEAPVSMLLDYLETSDCLAFCYEVIQRLPSADFSVIIPKLVEMLDMQNSFLAEKCLVKLCSKQLNVHRILEEIAKKHTSGHDFLCTLCEIVDESVLSFIVEDVLKLCMSLIDSDSLYKRRTAFSSMAVCVKRLGITPDLHPKSQKLLQALLDS